MVKRQILIVLDNLETSQLLQTRLERFGIESDCATSLSTGLEYAAKNLYCLLIIDLQMSQIGNEEMVRIFRLSKRIPILVLTEALTVQEKINLFQAGMDAFFEKPIDVDVCTAQASALIKLYFESNEEAEKSAQISFGTSLIIAPRYRQALSNGKPIALTRREFDLLYFFARHPGQVFSRDQIYDCVWGDYYELGGDETVKVHIKTLRKKLSALNAGNIENVRAVGYRFVPLRQE